VFVGTCKAENQELSMAHLEDGASRRRIRRNTPVHDRSSELSKFRATRPNAFRVRVEGIAKPLTHFATKSILRNVIIDI
jgi:hypothetical protein